MLKKDPGYRRLKLGRAGLTSTSSFWQAPDHLLIVEVTGCVEKYRRFYFRDIQAVIVQKTRTRSLWNVGLIMGLLLMLVILLQVSWDGRSDDAAGLFICAFLAFSLIASLALNLLRGPTCTVLIRTAVQTQVLPNINRRKKADKLVEQIGPAIIAAQTTPAAPAATATTTSNPSGASPG